jgi:hypothetical protein
VSFLTGRWKDAQTQSAIGEQSLRDHGADVRWEIDQVEFFAAAIAWQLGDARELVRRVSTHLRDAEERGDVYCQRGLRGWRANVAWLATDQPSEARAHLAAVAQPLQPGESAQLSHYYEALSAAQIDLYEGEVRAAHARMEAIWPRMQAALLTRIPSVRVEGGFMRARAALSVAAGDEVQRAELVRFAAGFARGLRKERMPWADALAAAVRAGVERVGGDRDAEAHALREAAACFDQADMTLYAAATRRRLALVLGEEEGRELGQAAEAAFAAQAIPNVPALCRLMLGFAD